MTSIRIFAVLIGGFTLLWTGIWPSTPASAQVVERGVQGAAVGAIIGGIVGGGRGAGTGAAIGAGVGVLSGAAEANARAHGYYGSPPPGYYRPPPARYYGPPPHSLLRSAASRCRGRRIHQHRSAGSSCLRAAALSRPRLHMDARLLGLRGRWLLLGTRYLGAATCSSGCCGRPATGVTMVAFTFGTPDIGGRTSDIMAASITASVMSGPAMRADIGNTGRSFTTPPSQGEHDCYHPYLQQDRSSGTVTVNNVSFNGPGGITVKPTSQEVAWSRKRHTQPTATQAKHQRAASANRALYTAVNHGTPTIAATAKPGVFNGPEIVGPKAVVATTKAAVGTGLTAPDDKARPHRQDGAAPGASGEAGPGAGQHAPGERHGPSAAAANGGVASDTGKKAFKPANMVKAPTSPTATVEPAPKARAVLPPAISSISGDKPAEGPSPVQISPDESASTPSTPSSATSSGSSSSSSKSPTPASASAAGSGGPVQTANLEPTINIPPGTTRFGIEIGTVEKQAGLRPLWRDILTKHPALVAGLQARRMLAPDKKWQLIAGPFGSAAEATQVCDLFKKENFKCKATAFAGDVL